MVEIHRLGNRCWPRARYMVTLVEGNTWWDVSFHVTQWGAKRKARRFEGRLDERRSETSGAVA